MRTLFFHMVNMQDGLRGVATGERYDISSVFRSNHESTHHQQCLGAAAPGHKSFVHFLPILNTLLTCDLIWLLATFTFVAFYIAHSSPLQSLQHSPTASCSCVMRCTYMHKNSSSTRYSFVEFYLE